MTNRLIDLLNLRSAQLFDLDDAGRALVGSDLTGSVQLYELPATDDPAAAGSVPAEIEGLRPLYDFGEPVTGRYLPGTRLVVASVDDAGTERTQLWLIDAAACAAAPDSDAARPSRLVHDPSAIHTLLDVGEDTVVYSTNRRNGVDFDVVSRSVSNGEERVLYDGGGWFIDLALSPDGKWIVASRMTLLPASSQVLLIDVDGGNSREITDATQAGDWYGPRWLADGSGILAFSDSETERITVRRYDLAADEWTIELADPDADLRAWPSPTGEQWAVVRTLDGGDELTIYPVAGNAPSGPGRIAELPGLGTLTNATDVLWSPGGTRLGFTFTCPQAPAEAYAWDVEHGVARLTRSNPDEATADIPELSSFSVPAPDGEQIPVFVLAREPAATAEAEAASSAVLIIHGGPEGATVRSFSPVAAGLALAGHTVVLPNVRGSAGYGRRWLSLDDVELRLDSVADLAAVHAWLPSIGVDPARVALYGGSYGGYMVLAGLTFHPELWAAGVDIVGISSLTSFLENTSAYRRAYREREYGSLAEHRAVLEAASPLTRIDALRAPLFIIHGANDPRVPLSEAEQVAEAARSQGLPCTMLVYADEGHGLAKRANRLDAYPKAAEFLAEHLAPR